MDNVANSSFPTNYDLVIPIEETDQHASSGLHDKVNGAEEYMSGMQAKAPTATMPMNLNQKRVQLPNTDQERLLPATCRGSEQKRPSLLGESADDARYMPVSCLNSFSTDWVIKVKVTKKYPLKHYSNARGEGCLLNIDVTDKANCSIVATFFGDAARKWDERLVEGKVYSMSGGNVKMANKRFTTIKNDFAITFDQWC